MVTMVFDDVSLQKYGQSSYEQGLCSSMGCAIGRLDYKSMSVHHINIVMFINVVGTLLHILHTYAIFVFSAFVPSHALGA